MSAPTKIIDLAAAHPDLFGPLTDAAIERALVCLNSDHTACPTRDRKV
jgi:hypothetical protein